VSVSVPTFSHTTEEQLDAFAELITAVPELPIILEHLGGSLSPFGANDLEVRAPSFALSRYPNVYMKFGGLSEIAERSPSIDGGTLFVEPLPRYHAMAYEAFGPQRLMWGSNFPPVAHLEGYLGALRSAIRALPSLTAVELAQIFGGTAASVYFNGDRA
jgi:L-fuconolactonase